MNDDKKLKVFVYGTLKKGGHFAAQFDKFRVSNKNGQIKGTMFSVFDRYPGVVLQGDNVIKGEVHEYENAAEVSATFDRIEGYGGEGNPNNLYDKTAVLVDTDNGQEECLMYVFARDTSAFKQVLGEEWKI